MTPEHKEQLKKVLTIHEGKRLKPYPDTKGILTIGIGHNLIAKPLPMYIAQYLEDNECITEEMENELFEIDLADAVNDCEKLYPNFNNFPDHIQIALVDLMFNLGYHKLSHDFAQTTAHVNAEEWDDVQEHLKKSKWYTQVHQRAKDDIALIEEGEKDV